ncbi:MAG: LPXTG cell wall anchor domain-containing protein, partial [Candidatus Aenigmarchaeota archaeon]|nr:LPXTG cell wall anchor domain-containing protein [Candidatus Aenigmarchaeota archaeon]
FSSKTYNFKLTVKSTNKEKTKNMILEVTKANLMNAKNIQILSIVPETALIPGKTTRFFVTLENTGTKAEYGLLQLNNFGNWNMTPEYKYIGLDPNIQTTIIFEVNIPKNANLETKKITATLIGQTLTTKELIVEITTNNLQATPTGLITKTQSNALTVAIILIILAGAIYLLKKKKK